MFEYHHPKEVDEFLAVPHSLRVVRLLLYPPLFMIQLQNLAFTLCLFKSLKLIFQIHEHPVNQLPACGSVSYVYTACQ